MAEGYNTGPCVYGRKGFSVVSSSVKKSNCITWRIGTLNVLGEKWFAAIFWTYFWITSIGCNLIQAHSKGNIIDGEEAQETDQVKLNFAALHSPSAPTRRRY